MRVVAITGAGGAIGPVAAAEFAAAGFEVRALTRANADVSDCAALRRAFAGVDCVVHLAAKLHLVDPPPSLGDEYVRVNVGGTENVVRAAAAEGVRRIVHVSTIAVYGYDDGRLLTEDSQPRPDTLYGKTKLESEAIALSAGAAVLRFAAVYGPRVKGNYRRLLMAMNRGRFVPLGSGANRRTLVYDRDAARAAVIAASHPAAASELFNVTDGGIHTVGEILTAMANALGRPIPRVTLPVAPIRMAAGVAELAAKLTGTRPRVTRSMIDKYVEDVTVSGEKIRRTLGFEPAYDLDHGWRETVALMREAGDL